VPRRGGLLRRGIIAGQLARDESEFVLRCMRLPAPWLLRRPERSALANAMRRSRPAHPARASPRPASRFPRPCSPPQTGRRHNPPGQIAMPKWSRNVLEGGLGVRPQEKRRREPRLRFLQTGLFHERSGARGSLLQRERPVQSPGSAPREVPRPRDPRTGAGQDSSRTRSDQPGRPIRSQHQRSNADRGDCVAPATQPQDLSAASAAKMSVSRKVRHWAGDSLCRAR
jgi:hypothetical protein